MKSTTHCQLHTSLFSIVIVSLSMLLFTQACKKGDTGPAGAAGPAGTANVIYSTWFTPAAYTKDTVFGIWGFNYNKATADITQQILDSGAVITYAKLLGYNPTVWPAAQVAPLPIQLTYVSGSTMTDTWSALATPGNLRIKFVNDKNFYTTIATMHQFRYVIIPGGKKTPNAASPGNKTVQAETTPEIQAVIRDHKKMSYAEVCRKLGIPE
jgi:hypothetical protein